jgi:hypothetical protein
MTRHAIANHLADCVDGPAAMPRVFRSSHRTWRSLRLPRLSPCIASHRVEEAGLVDRHAKSDIPANSLRSHLRRLSGSIPSTRNALHIPRSSSFLAVLAALVWELAPCARSRSHHGQPRVSRQRFLHRERPLGRQTRNSGILGRSHERTSILGTFAIPVCPSALAPRHRAATLSG